MKKITTLFLIAAIGAACIQSCKKSAESADPRVPSLPDEVLNYAAISSNANGFAPNGSIVVDNHKATLGRVLFYETQLSVNNRVSCGSCHLQSKAFADKSSLSSGFENGSTKRNTPAIINPGTQSSYFWDMRESNLASMVTQPIANHIEMGLDQTEYIVAKVKKLDYYKALFTDAYGDENVTISRIGDALSNFVGSMITVNSRYDMGISTGFANFTEQEREGMELFNTTLPCRGCHGGENFSGWGSFTQNIGLEMDYSDNGQPGTDWNTGRDLDGWFKVPSLRNVAMTGPYMHDGRFNTLEEVVEFYNSGIQPHDQLSFSLRQGWNGGIDVFVGDETPVNNTEVNPLRLNLTQDQKSSLVAFLKTLSDEQLISDEKFSNPFIH